MNREELRAHWEARIQRFRSSGEKAKQWCTANQVNRRQLSVWMKRLDAASMSRTTFLPIELANEQMPELDLPEAAQPAPPGYLRIRIGTAVIEVEAGFEPGLLREVVRAMEVDPVC